MIFIPRCLLILVCLAIPVLLLGQQARLNGTVTDASGAALPDTEISATQTDQNRVFQTRSGPDGHYVFPQLPIGAYTLKVERSGFKTFVQSGIDLSTNADSLLNITLSLGSVTEQVTVSAEASRVSTESATLQQLVDTRRIVDLPLNGRDVYQLATLVPGVGRTGTNIGGGRSGSQNSTMTNVRVDGTLNVDNAFGTILPAPSPDAVQEFTIQTSVPPARYGFASGVIEIATRSGTNDLHGSLYDFFRNDALDARNFFLPTKTRRRRNQYGFAGGGPVLIPKLYNGRNSTFWFLNLEQQKEPKNAPQTIFVPSTAQLSGDFSALNRVVKDPVTNQQFPGNRIPANRLDPLALNFIKQYVPTTNDPNGTYIYQRPDDNSPTQVLLRGDRILAGGTQQLNARLFITRLTQPSASGNLPAFQTGSLRTETDLYGINHTWTISPNKINTARFGFNGFYTDPDYKPNIALADLKKLGFADNYYAYTPNFPLLNVTGYFQASIEQIRITRDFGTFSWSDDFSWIAGKHTIQFGTDGIRTIQNTKNLSRTNGSFTYNGSFSGLAITDFLLGRPSAFRQGSPAPDSIRGLHLAWYAQDDIKFTRRLTVNLGLRYELPLPSSSANNAAIVYAPGAQSGVYKNAPKGILFPGDPGVPNAGRVAAKTLFAPRVGLAYALTGDQKTMLRSGYGVYYNPSWTNIEGQFAIYQPFTRIIDINAPPSTSNPWSDFPGGNPHPYQPGPNSVFDQQITGLSYGPNFTEPMMQQWNLNFQREFAHNWLTTIGYVGSRGTHIPYLRDINPAVYIPGQSTVANVNSRRPLYPAFARFSLIESVVNSNYNSLQASLDKRLSRGLTVLASYTFSKALTDLTTVLTNTGGVQDPNNRRAEWGPADYDRTHAFVTSWVYEFPFYQTRGWQGAFIGGWQLNGIWSMYSGAPLQFTLSQDRALRGQPNRPDRIKDPRLATDRPRVQLIDQYFDRSAFVVNQTGQFGSAPRAESQLRAPGEISVTLGLVKHFRGFAESHRIELRGEAFNALNRPNFSAPGTNPDTPGSYGRITAAAEGRIIQLALKYRF